METPPAAVAAPAKLAVRAEVKSESKPANPPVVEVRERPLGTLSPRKVAPPPVRETAKKPYKKPSTVAWTRPAPPASPWAKAVASSVVATPAEPREARPTPDGVRLSKVMSERAMCSRREADLWIERGWVFVDGERISELGSRIKPEAEITISKEAKHDQAKQVTILLNKPVGYVSGQAEDGYEPAMVLIRPERSAELLADLKERTGLNITKVEVGTIDFLKDTALLYVYYDSRDTNLADSFLKRRFGPSGGEM